MPTKIRKEVNQRIVLAKLLQRAGETSCARCNNQMAFTKGILLLHDAVEAALGAIADHLNVRLKDKNYLMNYYDLIEKEDKQNRTVPYKTQMLNLNTLRNNAKHQGILPDPKSNIHFPITVHALLEEVCQTYLNLDFDSVSLKSLIRNKKILDYIEKSEKEIEKGKIKEGLILLAYAMYHICESSTIPWLFRERETTLQFTRPYEIEYRVELIEHGVDPFLYYRFKNLTPMIVRSKNTGGLLYYWNKNYGHSANWTSINAHFCLDFCIDTALKFQREEYEGYKLTYYTEVFEDIIEPLNEEATIWNQSSHPSKYPFKKPLKPRSPLLVLKKGQSIIGYANDSSDRLDEWIVISKDIPSKNKKHAGIGFVLKNEVKITQKKRQVSKKLDNS